MKKDLIQLISSLDQVQGDKQYVAATFPSSQQIHDYQQLAYNLRSNAISALSRSLLIYFKSLWLNLKNRRAHRQVLSELDQLDAFMLKDIGLTRSDVEALHYGSTTVEKLNERRSSSISDRQKINKLQVCQCNEKLGRKIMTEPLSLAQCG